MAEITRQSDYKKFFFRNVAQTSPYPLGLEIEKAEGIFLFDSNGGKYMDLISGIAVSNIGHRHPRVVQAIKDQLDRYMHVMAYGEFIQKPQSLLAHKLLSLLPGTLDNIYFVNSGTEANEGAIKLAKRITGRTDIVSFYNSYHGSTLGSLSVSGNEKKKFRYRPLLPGVHFLRFNNTEELGKINEKTAAVIIEPIQGDAEVRIPSTRYLKRLREKCNDTGTLLIFDEVQTGFGRTGKLFAFEHYDVVPDILTMAKAMGGGMPIGAFISSKEKMQAFTHDPILGHITTFGGHPVHCAAALANLEVLIEDRIIGDVEYKGALFEKLLKHKGIKEIRRKGLMIALEFESEEIVQKIVKQCLNEGIITFGFLSTTNSIRLAPPLIITENQITEASSIIKEIIKKVIG